MNEAHFTVTTSTAWAAAETLVTLENIPSFSASGTDCAALINNYFGGYIHDVHLVADQSFHVETPLLTGDNTWLDIAPGVTITSANGENGPVVQNAHQTFVNLSGSANTVSPLVSATAPLFGDQNIMITGGGMTSSVLDNNRNGQTSISRPGYAYTVTGSGASAVVGSRCVFVADFSGVNNLVLSDFGMTNQTVFALTIGNCQHVLRRNLEVFKPALTATNSQYWARDDNFHDDGSVAYEQTENCYAMDNNDNSFCWNPGDYWTCSPNGYNSALVIGGPNPSPYWNCKWANIGPDKYIKTTGTCYTNAQGPGWYELHLANPALESDVEHSRFDHFYLDNPNPFRGEFEETVTFVGDMTDVDFDDWYIGPLRTAGDQGFGVAFSTWNGVRFSGWVCPGFTGNSSFFGMSAGYYSNVSIENCNIAGTGGANQYLVAFNASGSPSALNGLVVSNNVLTGMGSIFDVNGSYMAPVQNVSGDGNTFINPAPGAEMITLASSTPMPSGLSGQFTTPLAEQYGNAYVGAVLMTTANTTNLQSPIALVYRNEAAAWVDGVSHLLSAYQYVGSVLALYQNNGNGAAPIQFGPLANNMVGAYNPFSSGTNGAYLTSWEPFTPVPPALTGSGPMTIWAVDSCPDTSTSRGIISLQESDSPYAGYSLEASGPTNQASVFIGPSFVIVSGLPGIYSNQPVGNCFTYDGNLTPTLRTFSLTGTADALVTGTLPTPVGSLSSVTEIGLGGRGSLSFSGESETVHDYLFVIAALPDSTVSALKTLWQNCFQEYAAQNDVPSGLTVVGSPAQNVTPFGAGLVGTVNPGGLSAYAWFQYGLTNTYTYSTSTQAIGNPTAPATILASLSGLEPATTYHYCLTGSSGALVVTGSDMTFQTPPVTPTVAPAVSGNVTTAGASLSGSVNPGGLDAQVYFVYGLTGTYGSQTAMVDLGNGTTSVSVEALLAGLLAGTQYHYQIVVTNSNGVFDGGDQTFATIATQPLAASLEALKGDPADGAPGTTFSSFGPPIVNANGHIAFAASLASAGTRVSLANSTGIWADDSAGLRHLIARTGGTAAGLAGAGYSSLGNPVYNDAEQIAFLAQLKLANGTRAGIFSNIGGTLMLVRMQGDQADALAAGASFKAFKGLVLTNDSIVFEASLSGIGIKPANNTGIWATRISTGQTQLIARTGTVDGVTGKTFKTLTIFPVLPVVSGQSRSADPVSGNIAYLATFTDGTSALIKVTMQ